MIGFYSLALYLACFLGSAGLLYLGIKKKNKVLKFIAVMTPAVLLGIRVNVGTDYPSYVELFDHYSRMTFSAFLESNSTVDPEIGFFALIKLAAVFTTDSWLMFLLSSVLTVGIAYLAIKRLSPNYVPQAFLLYLLVLVPFTTNGMRQGIAMSIIFFAYSYILRGKSIKYLLTVVLASLFHTSAIVILPLYFLRTIFLKRYNDGPFTLVLSVVTAASAVLFIPLTMMAVSTIPALSVYARYVGWEAGVAKISVILLTFLSLVIVGSYQRLVRENPYIKLMAALFFLEFASLFLGGISEAFSRVSFYLAIGGIIYLANLPSIVTGNAERLAKFAVLAYGLFYFILFYFILGYSEIFPYNSVWSSSI